MNIQLSLIKPSPNPIRKTWDETKMDELRWSLIEEGQVEPIGVHENGAGYVIVWGHRRVEAARRAGWKEIEAVIVPADEVNNLIQAGIENLASEDMPVMDKANWAYRLNVEFGLSLSEIERRSTVKHQVLGEWLLYKRQKEEGLKLASDSKSQDEGLKKIREVYRVHGDDFESKQAVLKKAEDDDLSINQTRAVAEAYRDAPTPEVKRKVLEVPIVSRDTAADILRRSINRVEMETGVKLQEERNDWQKEREERRAMDEWDFAVKEFLDFIRLSMQSVERGKALIKYGKYSPEAARYAIRKIENLIDDLKTYREELEGLL